MQVSHLLVLCISLIFILLRNKTQAKNINYSHVKPLIDPTPFPNSFKCFTCEKAKDNYSCNRWAEDKWCPQHTHFCKTVHHFNSHGRSTSVAKKCATRVECQTVGCHHRIDSGHTECISCCDGMICNVEVPTNHTNAVFSVMKSYRKSHSFGLMPHISLLALAILVILVL